MLAPQRSSGPLVGVRVLGALVAEAKGVSVDVAGPYRRRLLALLASRPGQLASVESIVDSFGLEPGPELRAV